MQDYNIGGLIKRISCRIGAQADANMKRYGLTFSQSRVVAFIGKSGGELSQREIERTLHVSHPTVTGLVKRLESAGFVACRPCPEDKRAKLVALTEKGNTALSHFDRGRQEFEEKLVSGLTAREKAELVRLLSIMEENVK